MEFNVQLAQTACAATDIYQWIKEVGLLLAIWVTALAILKALFSQAGIGTMCLLLAAYLYGEKSKNGPRSRSQTPDDAKASVKGPRGFQALVQAKSLPPLLAVIGMVLVLAAFFMSK